MEAAGGDGEGNEAHLWVVFPTLEYLRVIIFWYFKDSRFIEQQNWHNHYNMVKKKRKKKDTYLQELWRIVIVVQHDEGDWDPHYVVVGARHLVFHRHNQA